MQLVKVKYIIKELGDGLSSRAYTYYSSAVLSVGDIVEVPIRDRTGKAQVVEVDVDESEVESFRDRVKVIPAGAWITPPDVDTEGLAFAVEAAENGAEHPWTSRPDPNAWRSGEEEVRKEPTDEELAKFVESNDNAPYLPDTGYIDEAVEVGKDVVLIRVKPQQDPAVYALSEQAERILDIAKKRVIKTIEDLKPATEDLTLVRRLKKALEEKRKEYVNPLNAHVKSINDTFRAIMEPIEAADKLTSSKMLAFEAEQNRIRAEQERINAMREEAARKQKELTGEITEVEKVEVVVEAPTRVITEVGSASQRDNWKWELVDINLVPREYLMVNVGLLTPVVKASKGKLTIPGIRIYNEIGLTTRTRSG